MTLSGNETFSSLRSLLRAALDEDLAQGDITTQTTCDPFLLGTGRILAKSELVLSGMSVVHEVFDLMAGTSATIKTHASDGQRLSAGTLVAEIDAPVHALLGGERVMLNLLMRLSGIATYTAQASAALAGSKTRLLDTRKTTPLWRSLEKAAVRHGGGFNHRFNLADGVLIKDNHATANGGVGPAIRKAREGAHHLLKIECEIQSIDQLEEAISAGADVLLLDNMNDATLTECVRRVAGRAKTEASGNMSIERLPRIAKTGVDFVSMGALTHSAPAADLSMKITVGR